MDAKILQKLEECRSKGRKLHIKICNDHSQVGQVIGVIDASSKYKIVNDFDFKVKSAHTQVKCLNIALEDTFTDKNNSFHALVITDVATGEVIYKNKFQEALQKTNPNNYNPNSEKLDKWKKDKTVKCLLKNIGQHLEITYDNDPKSELFEKYSGILKAAFYIPKTRLTKLILVKFPSCLCEHILKNDCQFKLYSNISNEYKQFNYKKIKTNIKRDLEKELVK